MTPIAQDPITAPIEYPTVTIGGRVLVVKADLYAQYLLSKKKISIGDAMSLLLQKDAGSVAALMDLWAACVADNYRRAREAAPSAEDWAADIAGLDDDAMTLWRQCCVAMGKALKKVFRTPQAPAVAAENAPVQTAN